VEFEGRLVLDVGCGAGRFAEVALDAGARVVALDYSNAVDAARLNLGSNARLEIVQGDIYALPFAPGTFDFVYCFGVLQHTPDVTRAFRALPPLLRPGGRLAFDVYPRLARNLLWSKYWVRPITRRMDAKTLFQLIERTVPAMLRLARLIGSIPVIGSKLKYAIPVVDYRGVYPLSDTQHYEWSVLDTFDMLAPAFDTPQTLETVQQWLREAGLNEVSAEREGFNIGRGKRPL
jgi:SAM-dependent methyltransferase